MMGHLSVISKVIGKLLQSPLGLPENAFFPFRFFNCFTSTRIRTITGDSKRGVRHDIIVKRDKLPSEQELQRTASAMFN